MTYIALKLVHIIHQVMWQKWNLKIPYSSFLDYSAQRPLSFSGCAERSFLGENKLNIPDSSFTASSYLYDGNRNKGKKPDDRYVPSNARLNGPWGWSPRNNGNPNDYLQIDLGALRVVTAVETQGIGNPWFLNLEFWVTEYKLKFKKDMISDWMEYKDIIEIEKVGSYLRQCVYFQL